VGETDGGGREVARAGAVNAGTQQLIEAFKKPKNKPVDALQGGVAGPT
jgi:hypothetical protein